LNVGGVFAKGGIVSGLSFFKFFAFLRTLAVFLGFDEVMILNE
jgi:hypothetical protein